VKYKRWNAPTQEKNCAVDKKLKCAELFFSLFLNQGERVKDDAYLALCTRVVAQLKLGTE